MLHSVALNSIYACHPCTHSGRSLRPLLCCPQSSPKYGLNTVLLILKVLTTEAAAPRPALGGGGASSNNTG
jgi:hypothetical protein